MGKCVQTLVGKVGVSVNNKSLQYFNMQHKYGTWSGLMN